MIRYLGILISFSLIATFSVAVSVPAEASSKYKRVDCSKIKKRKKRKRCQRAQIRLLQDENRRRDKVIRHSERQSTKIDCATMAANVALGQASGLKGLMQHSKKALVNITANGARNMAARNKRTCVRMIKNYFWGKAERCERWLGRNNVTMMRNGRPYSPTRGYIRGAPRYCGWR